MRIAVTGSVVPVSPGRLMRPVIGAALVPTYCGKNQTTLHHTTVAHRLKRRAQIALSSNRPVATRASRTNKSFDRQ